MQSPADEIPTHTHRGRRWLLILLWVLGAAIGFGLMLYKQITPGETAATPLNWPVHTTLADHTAGSRLLMFLHPRCPCSRASLDELERLLVHAPGSKVDIFISSPAAALADPLDHAWSERKIPGVAFHLDSGGELARVFGALVSGHTVVFDRDGRLRFSGGITAGRGHVGGNAGSRAALAALTDTLQAGPARAQVFGCELFDASASPHAGKGTVCCAPEKT